MKDKHLGNPDASGLDVEWIAGAGWCGPDWQAAEARRADRLRADGEEQRPCPNCGQWARPYQGRWDCFNECAKRGFVAASVTP